MDSIALRVNDVSHRHAGRAVLTPASLSFSVEPGQRAMLVGANGVGKTTLLHRIVGLLDGPGTIEVGSWTVTGKNLRAVRRSVGLLWQNPDDALLLPTVIEDVAFGPVNDGLTSEDARRVAGGWLEQLGIGHLAGDEIETLSMGEKQMVSLAGVLARGPGLLLLDEPTAYLDREARERLMAALRMLEATMLIVSHDPAQWEALGECARIEVKRGDAA